MLTLKSFTEDHDRLMVHLQKPVKVSSRSHLSRPGLPLLSLRLRVFHPTTRIHVRLLGPCFKTGLMGAFSLESIGLRVRTTNYVNNTKKDFLEVQLSMPKHNPQAHARKSKPFKLTSINKGRCAMKSPNP